MLSLSVGLITCIYSHFPKNNCLILVLTLSLAHLLFVAISKMMIACLVVVVVVVAGPAEAVWPVRPWPDHFFGQHHE